MLAGVLAEKFQRNAEHSSNFGIVGAVLDEVGNHPDVRRHLDTVQGNQWAQGPDHFNQARRQADFFFGLAQGGKHQVGVFRVAASTGKGHFTAMGREPTGAQGQDQLRFVAAGNRHQHCGLGETPVGFQRTWRMVDDPLQ
ncbi:hypothetical protein D3C73_1408610 [compost metagenome]